MFTQVVELYRSVLELRASPSQAADEVSLKGQFSYSGATSERLESAIAHCTVLPEHMGRFLTPVRRQGKNVEFTWSLSQNSHVRFFKDTAALVCNSDTVHQGSRPINFYLLQDDFEYGNARKAVPAALRRLNSLCDFIACLEKLAGQVVERRQGPAVVFFMLPARDGKPPRAMQVRTKITPGLLQGEPLDLTQLQVLVNKVNDGTTHYLEKQALLRVAIADAISNVPTTDLHFSHLVHNWEAVLNKFKYDFECYVGQYSFDTFISRLADTQADFASRLTRVMGDTASKFLALPLPVIALVGILHSNDLVQSYLIFLGALLLSLLYSAQVQNQLLEVSRIQSAFDLVVTRLRPLQKNQSGKAATALEDAIREFYKQEALLLRTLKILWCLAWLPIIVGLTILAYQYHPAFHALAHAGLQNIT